MLLGGGLLLPGVILLLGLWLRSPAPEGTPPNAAPLPGPESAPAASLEAAPSLPDAAPAVPREGAAAEVESPVVLAGRLVDGPSGVPLAFAEAQSLLHGGARLRPLAITTDADGRFTLRGIEPGTHVLETRHAAYLPARNSVEVPARVAPGGDLEQAIPEIEVVLFPGASLEGEIVTGAGAPIEGARIRLFLLGEGGPEGAAARTNSHGRFTLRSLESGTWRVLAGATGFRRASTEVQVPEEARIRIVLGEDAGLFVAVLSAEGVPVEGAHVKALGRTGGLPADGGAGVTREDGRIRLQGLLADGDEALVLEVKHPRFAPERKSVSGEDLERGTVEVVLSPGVEIGGRVVDGAGEPVSGAVVEVSKEPGGVAKTLRTTSRGEFLFRRLAAGMYDVRATTLAQGSSRLERIEAAAEKASALELRLEAGAGSVGGRVVDGQGNAVVLCPVTLSSPGTADEGTRGPPALRTVTDEDGAFRFDGLVAGGTTTRELVAGGGKLESVPITVEMGESGLLLVVERFGSIRGMVSSPGEGRSHAIRLAGPARGAGAAAPERTYRLSSGEGSFHLRGLAPGKYKISVLTGGAEAPGGDVEVIAGEEVGPVVIRP